MRSVVAAVVGVVSFTTALSGQAGPPASESAPAGLPRWRIGLAADIGQPVGGFKRNVDNGVGLQGHVLLRLDHADRASIRFEGGWLNYGHESQRSCVGTTPGCRVAVSVTTANGILSLGLGPQVTLPLGPVRAYGYGLVGISRVSTVSGLGGGLMPDIVAGDENFGDTGLAVSGGLGLQLPLRRFTTLDAGVSYQGNGRRSYLIKGGLTDRPDGSLAFDIKRSAVDLFAFRLGLTSTIPWGRRTSKP